MKRVDFLIAAGAVAMMPGVARAKGTLRAKVAPWIDAIPGSVGVYARTMANGAPLYTYNADVSFPSASTIKMVIMLTAFHMAERDPDVMNARVTYDASQLIGGSEFMEQQADGAVFTVHELIVPMIQVSDNTASNLLITHFGFDLINGVTHHAGMLNTHLKRHFLDTAAVLRHMDNRTTPADMAHLLYQIERGAREEIATVAKPASCRQMIQIMLGQTDRDTIPRFLPKNIAVANKTGELSRSRSDVAIVDPYGDSPYVLAVYTNGLDSPGEAYDAIAHISSVIYGAVANSDL